MAASDVAALCVCCCNSSSDGVCVNESERQEAEVGARDGRQLKVGSDVFCVVFYFVSLRVSVSKRVIIIVIIIVFACCHSCVLV